MEPKTIIKEQREELEGIEKTERIIPRDLLPKAIAFLKYPNVVAIVGVRRCGKSVFSYLTVKDKNFGYINFDDERLAMIKADDLNKILQAFYELYPGLDYIILDEIQNVKNWELFVNRLRRTKRVIITGSNSRLLSGELSTHLTGRYIDIELHPFSFREFLILNKVKLQDTYTTKEMAEITKHLEDYLRLGGFPEVKKFGKAILPRIYNDIITKDIILRYKVKKIEALRNMARYIITNFSQGISYAKLSRILNVKRIQTISTWISYLEDSFLIFKLERFSFKLKQQIIAPKKIYCIDNGILTTIGFGFSENKGFLIENIVAIELSRRKALNPLFEIYYWKDHQQNEVDFVIKHGKRIKQLIQVTCAKDKDEIREREIKSLSKCSYELQCNKLSVITWDYEGKEKHKRKTIEFIPLWKWLLF